MTLITASYVYLALQENLGPFDINGITVSRGKYGRPRWRCRWCRMSGVFAGAAVRGTDMVSVTLAAFIARHRECGDDGWR